MHRSCSDPLLAVVLRLGDLRFVTGRRAWVQSDRSERFMHVTNVDRGAETAGLRFLLWTATSNMASAGSRSRNHIDHCLKRLQGAESASLRLKSLHSLPLWSRSQTLSCFPGTVSTSASTSSHLQPHGRRCERSTSASATNKSSARKSRARTSGAPGPKPEPHPQGFYPPC